MTTGLRARKADRTRRAIAEAALKAIQRQGYGATTLDEVAEAADVHKRTLLRYFPTKAHLLLDAHHKALDGFRKAMAERGGEKTIDVWEAHVARWSQKVMEKGPLANIGAVAANEPAIQQALLAIEAQYAVMISEAIWTEFDHAPDKEVLAHVAAAALVGGNYAIAARQHETRAYADFTARIGEVVAVVRRTLLS
jgi:AcrR family transcriptional regulator